MEPVRLGPSYGFRAIERVKLRRPGLSVSRNVVFHVRFVGGSTICLCPPAPPNPRNRQLNPLVVELLCCSVGVWPCGMRQRNVGGDEPSSCTSSPSAHEHAPLTKLVSLAIHCSLHSRASP